DYYCWSYTSGSTWVF
nr:immunoglobulin light chain junction region [Macaca mulatta]MOX33693.1 immunoglobulin light chain junction region [Macaca mulatta]MOX33732.1 immunoglobulin light chain junction region [Macaca mulatta]MOX44173.1 immunoglobulin light chain junction region [Macaca mulatta]MOX45179.1 immunoglobulin light chain junction region [Macaca mulatta]